jgi:hypothetical protein
MLCIPAIEEAVEYKIILLFLMFSVKAPAHSISNVISVENRQVYGRL